MTWPNSKCNSWLDPASEVHSGFVLWWLDRFTFLQDINIDAVVEHSTVILQSLKYKTVLRNRMLRKNSQRWMFTKCRFCTKKYLQIKCVIQWLNKLKIVDKGVYVFTFHDNCFFLIWLMLLYLSVIFCLVGLIIIC